MAVTGGQGVTFARGFVAGAVAAGVKHAGTSRLDVAVIASTAEHCHAAGVFTTNQVIAAPCVVTKKHVARGHLRGIVVNSGNANACTGPQGERDAVAMANAAGELLHVDPHDVAIASTGVIGVPMPMERIAAAIPRIPLSEAGWDDASRAIMTTDTRPKVAQRELTLSGGAVRIGGMAKGAGMIHPNMATMLAFVTTDALIDSAALRPMLRSATDDSFNAISVDGDTSTNDTLLVLANGASGVRVGTIDGPAFLDALTAVCLELARAIVADGEGVTKVFEVQVTGAASESDARLAARTVTTSNLVKTAIHGADPNWGRILAAAGRSGAKVDPARASIRIGGVAVFERGTPRPFDAAAVRTVFERPDIAIALDLGLGDATARAWGTDLSAEYVRINADYTT
ncbi:MAG TPA: bifunctional glutamate N-acetyltransferase/amino-acid acetyltransferase ArgJ [Candidatus Saccharimonadales bacterium]|nr:bifunctional glutamate N-acetyltransferase/amino-acid acetyltransferase ArgJ [Candidatus Saccharimonadales bacterium]